MPQVITKDDAVTAADAAANAEAAQAALEGFASVDESEVKPVVEPKKAEPKPVEKTDAEKAAETKAADEAAAKAAAEAEWDGVPAKVRQTLEAISGKVGALDKIEHRLKGVEGRTGAALEGVHALKTALEAAKDAAKTVTKSGGDAPTQAQIDAAAKDPEKWEALKKDFEEWTQATEEFIQHKLAAERAETLKLVPKVDVEGIRKEVGDTVGSAVAKARTEAVKEARQLAAVDQKYPTWEEDIHVYAEDGTFSLTPEFSAWMNTQAPEVKALADSNLARDALKMLDLYYADRKAVAEATAKAERNKKRLDAAITPKGVATAQSNRTLTEEEAKLQGFLSVDT